MRRSKTFTAGFTLIEVLVAATILSLGAGVIWYTFGAALRIEFRGERYAAALDLAVREAENIRRYPRSLVGDTVYCMEAPGRGKFAIKRTVLDTAKIEEIVENTYLEDEKIAEIYNRPLEVRIRILAVSDDWDPDFNEDGETVMELGFLKPEYTWY